MINFPEKSISAEQQKQEREREAYSNGQPNDPRKMLFRNKCNFCKRTSQTSVLPITPFRNLIEWIKDLRAPFVFYYQVIIA